VKRVRATGADIALDWSGEKMHFLKDFRFLTYAAITYFITSPALAQNSLDAKPTSQTEVLRICESCHGAGGNSEVTSTPRLNGQQAEYIVKRVKVLSSAARSNPHTKIEMFKGPSAQSDATIVSIAKYFASQPPTNPKPGVQAAAGRYIYENGIAKENVIACKLCHGAQGEGHDATPRLAGQHADYLNAQLRLFNIKFREHVLMNPNTKAMTKKSMDALASYLAND